MTPSLQHARIATKDHFLVDSQGRPFFWLADTAWELFYRLDRDETDCYLKDRAEKGFTVIQAVATGKVDPAIGPDDPQGLQAPNRYGQRLFHDSDPERPNERYFEHIDWVIERAAHYGLRIALLPTWGCFVCHDGKGRVFNVANAEVYGRWLANRYRGRGILWVLGGDVTPLWPGPKSEAGTRSIIDFRPVYDAMARGIRIGDPDRPFITYHPSGVSPSGAAVPRMSLYFHDRDWLDMSMLQSGHFQAGSGDEGGGNHPFDEAPLWTFCSFVWNGVFNYLPIHAEYCARPTRPVIDAEPCYESCPILDTHLEARGFWSSIDVRRALYQSLFAGAAGYTYGHFSVWDFHDPKREALGPKGAFDKLFDKYTRPSWQEVLEAPGASQMRHAKALMLSRPYFSRVPDPALIVGELGEGSAHIGATRCKEGSYAMVYLPQGQTVTVDLTRIQGPHAVGWWFDPRTGQARSLEQQFSIKSHASFVPPTRGEDQDWVLVIDSDTYKWAAPGAPA